MMELLLDWYGISLLILPVLIAVIYFFCCYKLNYWKRRGVPQLISTSKIFGDLKEGILFRTAPGRNLDKIYREAPSDVPYVGFYIFHKPCLLLKDPELIKNILIRDFEVFADRHFGGSTQLDSIGMINLFGLKAPAWRYLRNKTAPTLSKTKLKRMLPLMLETGIPMMDYLKKQSDDLNKDIDIEDVSYRYTADLIANVAFGAKIDSFKYPNSICTKSFLEYFKSFRRMLALLVVFFVPEVLRVLGTLPLFDLSFAYKMFWNAVESREKSGKKRGDYIDSIIQFKNGTQNPLYKFEGDNLLYHSATFISGFESGSMLSAFILMELAKNKKYQERAREDVKNAVDQYGWTMDAFDNMKYLGKCVAEGVRLYPSVNFIDRYTLQDYKIPDKDLILEKGTPIYISLYGLHGDPKYFNEPEIFNPERFDDDKTIPEIYLPYGNGPRMCIGAKFGQLQVKVVLSMILSEFEVHQRAVSAYKLDKRSTFTKAANGVHIKFTQIKQ